MYHAGDEADAENHSDRHGGLPGVPAGRDVICEVAVGQDFASAARDLDVDGVEGGDVGGER